MALTEEQERAYLAELERMGPTQVRSDLDHGRVSPALVFLSSSWLSNKEKEAERQREALSSEQIELTRRASEAAERASAAAERQATAAERANTRAALALVIATISMMISIVGILVDAHK
jgi:hypothetical protein